MERERERERQGVVDGGVRVTGFSFASNDQPRSPLFGFSTNARLPRLSSILCCVTSAPSAALCAATFTKPLDLFYLCLSLSLCAYVCSVCSAIVTSVSSVHRPLFLPFTLFSSRLRVPQLTGPSLLLDTAGRKEKKEEEEEEEKAESYACVYVYVAV